MGQLRPGEAQSVLEGVSGASTGSPVLGTALPSTVGGATGVNVRSAASGLVPHGKRGISEAGGRGGPSLADLARWEARLAMLLVQEQLGHMQLTLATELQEAREELFSEHAAREAALRHDVAALEQEVARLKEEVAGASGAQTAARSPTSTRSRDAGSASALQSVNGGPGRVRWREGYERSNQRAGSRELGFSFSGGGDAASVEAIGAAGKLGEGVGDGAESLREQHLLQQLRDAQEMLQARRVFYCSSTYPHPSPFMSHRASLAPPRTCCTHGRRRGTRRSTCSS